MSGGKVGRGVAAVVIGVLAALVLIATAASAPAADHQEEPSTKFRPADAVKNAKVDTVVLRVSRAAATSSGAAIAVAESANLDVEQN